MFFSFNFLFRGPFPYSFQVTSGAQPTDTFRYPITCTIRMNEANFLLNWKMEIQAMTALVCSYLKIW